MPADTPSSIELLEADAAKKVAESVLLNESFAKLNIFRALLHRPKTAKALADLLISLLFEGELDHRLRELVIMRIGWATGSDYEWTQHWSIAQDLFKCSEADLLAVRDWRKSEHFGEAEKAVLETTDQLLETGDVDRRHIAHCLELFGRDATLELVVAVGTWRLVSKVAKTFEIPLEEGVASWPPDRVVPESATKVG